MPARNTVTIDIADMAVTLRTDDAALADRLRARYADFLAPGAAPCVTVDVHVRDGLRVEEPVPGTTWVTRLARHGDALHYRSYFEHGTIDLAGDSAELTLAPDADAENFLRVLYAWLSLRHGGLLLHAAGVIRDGAGYVFFGPSGAGKSTVARLAAADTVVSDDLVVIRPNTTGWTLHGVPFRGELAAGPRTNSRAPLRALLRLRQSNRHALEPLSPSLATAELAAAAPFAARGTGLGDALVAVCARVARAVPVSTLHFRRDDQFWTAIDERRAHLSPTP